MNREKMEERIETAFWVFDEKHKGYGKWRGGPFSERDAFKTTLRQELIANRDGSWLDADGCCKLCDGEVPGGHATNCQLYKLERQLADETQRANTRVKKDTELLDWAENHPEFAMSRITAFWAHAGRGFREMNFNFRGAIEDAMESYEKEKS